MSRKGKSDFRFVRRQFRYDRRRRWNHLAEYTVNQPVSALYRTGAKPRRVLREKDRHGQQTTASVLIGIVHANPGVAFAFYFRHAVMRRQGAIHERVAAVQHIEHRAIVTDCVLDKPDWLLKHRLAEIAIEAGEALAVDVIVGFEMAKIEPVAAELSCKTAHPLILQHAASLGQQNILLLQIAGRRAP